MKATLCTGNSARIQRAELGGLVTPEGTRTHTPIAHSRLVDSVENALEASSFRIKKEQHAISHQANRYFGVFDLDTQEGQGYGLSIGLRNSHDKRFPAGMVVGSRVFVCDNLAFSAEIQIARKHTRFINRDLDKLIYNAMGRLGAYRQHQQNRIESYRETNMTDMRVNDFLVRSVDAKVIPVSRITSVLEEWRRPRHQEFEPRNAWSLFNGYTEVMKRYNTADVAQRTIRLHGMMDSLCGVN